MMYVITFLFGTMLGSLLGGLFGVFVMCACISAGEADDREEKWFDGKGKDDNRT